MLNNINEGNKEMNKIIEKLVRTEVEKTITATSAKIETRVESKITNSLVNKLLSKNRIKSLTNNIETTIDRYLKDLDDIVLFKANICQEIKQSIAHEEDEIVNLALDAIEKLIEKQKDLIKDYAGQAYELASYVENVKNRVIDDIVLAATKRIVVEDARPRTIEIYNDSKLEKILDEELYHQDFETIYKLIRIGLPVMLIGPTGSGKSACASQVAKALDMPMYYTNNASEEYKLLGFTDAHGKYKETQFYKAFKDGGLFFLDEIDNSHPSALLSLNSAIGASNNGNIYMAFEDGKYTEANPNFRIIAAANTWGNGANRMYCGRSELDSASLDRFIQIYFDYDPKIEKSIIDDEELLRYFWNFRRIINDCGIRHTVTTRNIDYASKLKKAGFSTEQILLYTVVKELEFEDMKIISKRFEDEGIEPSIYSEEFKKMVLKKA